ncbi:hypothetical protein [Chenggangzhangella methanolivorans]|uniref:Uncharacterized protein n=1 Tax=Chenggangzhangella methanolivorans TaxID=1437009 RepID=A0A9E6R768_9HYPH|nr:hypothetical protein [Chenggangzhangella methanolivorans]QZN99094.1 hypothetical protein K6K41_19920 [Chenggangzhangella methanolivorans]
MQNYRRRKAKRIVVYVEDVEPQSKKMPGDHRDEFQRQILDHLKSVGQPTYARSIALNIDLLTTSRTAPQAHTIAKNLLDLLAARCSTVPGTVDSVLYKDDSQIQALAVACRHGESRPSIRIEARSLTAMLNDLELALEVVREAEMADPMIEYQRDENSRSIEDFRELVRDEVRSRERLGDELYDAMLKMTRWSAQRALLSVSEIDLPVLCWLYGRPKGPFQPVPSGTWADLIQNSGVRLMVGELPVASGSSEAFKQRIAAAIAEFKARWGRLIDPLVVAVGLQVIVRPSPSTPTGVLHDLDNIVRDYLLPQIVPSFGTVSDHRWTIDLDDLAKRDPKLASHWTDGGMPPKGTKAGVTRYEVWRLPPDPNGAPGFVSVALVADMDAVSGLFEKCDRSLEQWAEKVEEAARERSRPWNR